MASVLLYYFYVTKHFVFHSIFNKPVQILSFGLLQVASLYF